MNGSQRVLLDQHEHACKVLAMPKKASPAKLGNESTNPQQGAPVAHCSFTKWTEAESVVPNPRNPNRHSEDQVQRIAKVIGHLGWRAPITVSARSGFVVRGHGRLEAAKAAGWTHVPIDEQQYESEAQEWADMIADNRLAELSERDRGALKDLVGELDTGEIDMTMTGYTTDELANLVASVVAPDEFKEYDEKIATTHVCPKCGYKWSGGSDGATDGESAAESTDDDEQAAEQA